MYKPGQHSLEENVIYRFDNDGHCLVIVQARIADQEIEATQNCTAELRLYIDGPIIFLLFKFGTGRWNDAPYSWHTMPRSSRLYPEQVADTATLAVMLVEATNGIVRAAREIAMTPDFAGKLNTAITAQANGSFNGLSYAKHLNILYN
ncbi:MAG: hypothetical protein ACRDBM_00260, partial [Sporomusa sp.]